MERSIVWGRSLSKLLISFSFKITFEGFLVFFLFGQNLLSYNSAIKQVIRTMQREFVFLNELAPDPYKEALIRLQNVVTHYFCSLHGKLFPKLARILPVLFCLDFSRYIIRHPRAAHTQK